jgi:hypothetical protein
MSAKSVEVRGRVVSVTTSPLGTTFINFGGEYPNQRFAGFIAAGSRIGADQRLTTIQGKTISITGTIELYKGKPEITVVSADQIKGLAQLARFGLFSSPFSGFYRPRVRYFTAS